MFSNVVQLMCRTETHPEAACVQNIHSSHMTASLLTLAISCTHMVTLKGGVCVCVSVGVC